MINIAEAFELKFGEAQRLYTGRNTPIAIASSTQLNSLEYETIGLDCEKREHFRYLFSRCSLDTQPTGIAAGVWDSPTDLELTHHVLRIRRMPGDGRVFEDLPMEAIQGENFIIDATANRGIMLEWATLQPRQLGAAAINALAEQLVTLRVAERMPYQMTKLGS